jgi:glycine dehydrogenase subunit 1
LAFTIHLSLLGEEGLTRLARINHAKASALADKLGTLSGVELLTSAFFNEFTIRLSKPAAQVVDQLAAKGVIAGVPVSRLLPHDPSVANLLIVAATETNTEEDFAAFTKALQEVL